MAQTQIKITQLPSIGSNIAGNTLFPVVNTAGTAITEKATTANLGNFILTNAGTTLTPAYLANLAYSVVNAAQPNITSVGTLNVNTLKISGGTNGQFLQTDGTGNLSWSVAGGGGGSYGDSNVTSLLASFGSNTITTTGNVSVGNIIGNGQALTGIAGANVNGAVGYASVANSVAVANVSGIGNIATVNLTGSPSNVLYGNGAFAAPTAGTTLVNGNSNVVVNANSNVVIGTNGNAAVADFGADGRMRMLNGAKAIGGNIAAGDGYIQFTSSGLTYFGGNVQFLAGGYIKGPGGTNVLQMNSPENSSLRVVGNLAVGASNTGAVYAGTITASGNANIGNIGTAGLITATGNINGGNLVTAGQVSATGNITTAGTFVGNGAGLTNVTVNAAGNINGTSSNVSLVAGSYTYTFDNTGNFTMPANSDIVFSGNTTLTSGAGTNGNVTVNPDGTGQFVLTSITPATFGNTLLVAGPVTSTGSGNAVGFLVGNSAVNNVALGFSPTAGTAANMAIRDLSTVSSVMFFDVVTGSTANGTFQFRSSNAYTTYANINAYGITLPTKPAFRVYGSGVTTITTTTNGNGTVNSNNWTVDYNQGSYLNSTNGTFTAPVAGLYQITLQMRVPNNTAPTAQAAVIKNVGGTPVNQVMLESAANPTINHFGTGTIAKLAAGDTLNLKVTVGTMVFDVNDNWSVAYLG
jgi:C1q domain